MRQSGRNCGLGGNAPVLAPFLAQTHRVARKPLAIDVRQTSPSNLCTDGPFLWAISPLSLCLQTRYARGRAWRPTLLADLHYKLIGKLLGWKGTSAVLLVGYILKVTNYFIKCGGKRKNMGAAGSGHILLLNLE